MSIAPKAMWAPSQFIRWYRATKDHKIELQQFYHDQSFPAANVEHESDDKCSIVLDLEHGEWRYIETVLGGN